MSYLAVVHADGNGMGRRVTAIGERYGASAAAGRDRDALNRDYIEALRSFSEAVEEASVAAQKQMLDALCARVDSEAGAIVHTNDSGRELNRITLSRESGGAGRWSLPFRPLVFGGDDLTFVCDGRLGLALAIDYVERFEDKTQRAFEKRDRLKDWCDPVTACAGVAVVKAHYPFARAYDLAETLTGRAKKLRRSIRGRREGWDGACLDWHFAQGELAGDLDLIREREYEVAAGDLTLRPVVLGEHPLPTGDQMRAWPVVQEGIEAFQSDKEGWAGRRNKIKRLRDALRGGQTEVEKFTDAHGDLPSLSNTSVSKVPSSSGWADGRCAYFDAVELADLHVPLD